MKTYTKGSTEWHEAIEQVYYFLKKLPQNDKLSNNYIASSMDTDEWYAISISEDSFSTIAYREQWNNSCRILNRFAKLPSNRFENKKKMVSEQTLTMINQQVQAATDMGFDFVFMSREGRKQAFNHYKQYLEGDWITPAHKYKMTSRSFQHVMYKPLHSNEEIDLEME
tara:strand:+ start:968 stop:1471 length:504 start_codon:yes stop_codon:yes gene_type:complete